MEKLTMEVLKGEKPKLTAIEFSNNSKNDITIKTSKNERGEIMVEILDNLAITNIFHTKNQTCLIPSNTVMRIEY